VNAKLCAALALAAGLFAAAAIAYGSGDGDLFWQRALGEAILRTHTLPTTLGSATFSAPDARWLPHEWLFATLWALANRRDAEPIFRLGCVGLACATMVVSLARARTAATPARMVMIVVGAIALLPSFGLRAQVVAWPLLALAMWALESGRRRAWLVLPLAVIWYNLHASALVVPCIVLVDGLGRTLDARRARPFLEAAALAGACTLASLATPFGPELPRFTLAWSTNPATRIIAEWEPASPGRALAMVGMVVIALLLVVGELRGARLRWSQRLLAAVLFAAALLHLRNLALFCIVAGPWTCAALSQLLPRDVGSRQRQRWSDAGLVALAVGHPHADAGAGLRRVGGGGAGGDVARPTPRRVRRFQLVQPICRNRAGSGPHGWTDRRVSARGDRGRSAFARRRSARGVDALARRYRDRARAKRARAAARRRRLDLPAHHRTDGLRAAEPSGRNRSNGALIAARAGRS
jgi:hypothetical protein